MKNKIMDLNNHLFEQLERLNDDDLSEEELDKEIKRTKGMTDVAEKILGVAEVAIEAAKLVNKTDGNFYHMLPMIGGSDKTNEDHPAIAPPRPPAMPGKGKKE